MVKSPPTSTRQTSKLQGAEALSDLPWSSAGGAEEPISRAGTGVKGNSSEKDI